MDQAERRRMRGSLLVIGLALGLTQAASAQNVERQRYVMSANMHHELDGRDFDSARVEQIVNGISQALDAKSLAPILEASSPEIRITENGMNKVVKKEQLASFKDRLFKDPALRGAIADESQFILKSDSIGLARGAFWIDEQCLNDACDQKKTSIVTINLP